jgi:hypothetical protein
MADRGGDKWARSPQTKLQPQTIPTNWPTPAQPVRSISPVPPERETPSPSQLTRVEPLALGAWLEENSYHAILKRLDVASGFAAPAPDKDAFADDCEQLRGRLRNIKKARKGIFDPRSAMMARWDMVTSLAMLFTATITPFEIGLGVTPRFGAFFLVNQVVNVVFLLDVVLQFFLPVPDVETGELIRDHWAIAKRYAKGWMLIDVVSILPFDAIELSGMLGSDGAGPLRSVRLFRALRLAKLVRVLRTSRVMNRWMSKMSISSGQMEMLGVLVGYSIFVHWFACLLAMVPQLQGSWREHSGFADALIERAAAVSSCTGCVPGGGSDLPDTISCTQRLNDCLTECEIDVLAELTGQQRSFVKNGEHWFCRAVETGLLPAKYEDQLFLTWLLAMENAALQFSGSVGAIEPANAAELLYYMLALT